MRLPNILKQKNSFISFAFSSLFFVIIHFLCRITLNIYIPCAQTSQTKMLSWKSSFLCSLFTQHGSMINVISKLIAEAYRKVCMTCLIQSYCLQDSLYSAIHEHKINNKWMWCNLEIRITRLSQRTEFLSMYLESFFLSVADL